MIAQQRTMKSVDGKQTNLLYYQRRFGPLSTIRALIRRGLLGCCCEGHFGNDIIFVTKKGRTQLKAETRQVPANRV